MNNEELLEALFRQSKTKKCKLNYICKFTNWSFFPSPVWLRARSYDRKNWLRLVC